ncbi:unnamed protein product [Penicillium palitans]
MSLNDAASIGLGLFTAGLGLFHELKVPGSLCDPNDLEIAEDKRVALVADGSTATGTRTIQLLKLAGLRPIPTCFKTNMDLVRRFGAENAFDYSDPECAVEIRRYTGGTLAYALDVGRS